MGFDTVEEVDGRFHATFHSNIPFDPEIGGFPWSVSLEVEAAAIGGGPTTDVTAVSINTIRGLRLMQVSDPNGNAMTVSFDSGLTFAEVPAGDFDWDGDVDGRDLLEWQRNPNLGNLADWQQSYGAGLLATAVAVPEPSTLLLLIVATVLAPRRPYWAFCV
jgi:hypothetical protein